MVLLRIKKNNSVLEELHCTEVASMQALIAKEKYESRQLLRNYSSMNNLVEQHLAIKVAES